MFYRLGFIILFGLSLLYANEIDEIKKDYVKLNSELIKNLSNQQRDSEIMKLFNDSKKIPQLQRLENEYNILTEAISSFENSKYFLKQVDKLYLNKIESIKDKDAFTITFFISEDIPFSMLKKFSDEIDVLKSYYPNIVARIFFNNYPKNYVNEISGQLQKTKFKSEIKKRGLFGEILLSEDGEYKYIIDELKVDTIGKKLKESFLFEDSSGKKHTVNFNLITNKKGELKIIERFSMNGIYRYAKEMIAYGIRSSNFKLQIHPWAFKEMKLNEVPAYLLSYCDNEDYRFKTCDNKYKIKGNVSLEYFFNEIRKQDTYYKKFSTSLLKGLNYD